MSSKYRLLTSESLGCICVDIPSKLEGNAFPYSPGATGDNSYFVYKQH